MTDADEGTRLVRRHLAVGWSSVMVFGVLGLVLEALHGFKVGEYLDVGQETRRLLFTLGHAHGTLLGLLNLAFAFTATRTATSPALAGRCLWGATLLLPLGFLLGGLQPRGGDPGLGILLVPPGAVLLIVGAGLTVRSLVARPTGRS